MMKKCATGAETSLKLFVAVSVFYFRFISECTTGLTIWRPRLSYGYSYEASRARPG